MRLRLRSFIPALAIMLSLGAQAQTTTAFVAGTTCDAAFSRCTAVDTAGTTVLVTGSPAYYGAVTLATVSVQGAAQSRACTAYRSQHMTPTASRRVDDINIVCGDGSVLAGTFYATRRGTTNVWTLRVIFDSWTVYP